MLIKKCKGAGLKHFNVSKVFIKYSNDIDDIYKNIEEYNPGKARKVLTIFDNMVPDMLSNKKLNPIVTELFVRSRKLSISVVFITQSYIAVPKNIGLNSTDYFIMKIPNKLELPQITINHSTNINSKDSINIFKKCIPKPYSFLVIDTTLA